DPTGDGPPASGQDGPEEQQGEPGCGPAVERGGESREPLARRGDPAQRCHGWLRPRRSAGMATAIVSVGPAFLHPGLTPAHETRFGCQPCRGFFTSYTSPQLVPLLGPHAGFQGRLIGSLYGIVKRNPPPIPRLVTAPLLTIAVPVIVVLLAGPAPAQHGRSTAV